MSVSIPLCMVTHTEDKNLQLLANLLSVWVHCAVYLNPCLILRREGSWGKVLQENPLNNIYTGFYNKSYFCHWLTYEKICFEILIILAKSFHLYMHFYAPICSLFEASLYLAVFSKQLNFTLMAIKPIVHFVVVLFWFSPAMYLEKRWFSLTYFVTEYYSLPVCLVTFYSIQF